MVTEDTFLDDFAIASPGSSPEFAKVLEDFDYDWQKSNNEYQGWLSAGASPEEAAAKSIKPAMAKWQAFAPIMRAMTTTSRSNPFSIFSTGGGELTRVDKRTGTAQKIQAGRGVMEPRQRMIIDDLYKRRNTIIGKEFRFAEDDAALADIEAKIAKFEQGPAAPAEPFEDAFEPRQQAPRAPQQPRQSFGFVGTPEGFDEGTPFGDNSFEMPDPSRQVPVSAPEPARRKKNTVYQTPKGPMKWTGTGWVRP